jgi:hypothetical protein
MTSTGFGRHGDLSYPLGFVKPQGLLCSLKLVPARIPRAEQVSQPLPAPEGLCLSAYRGGAQTPLARPLWSPCVRWGPTAIYNVVFSGLKSRPTAIEAQESCPAPPTMVTKRLPRQCPAHSSVTAVAPLETALKSKFTFLAFSNTTTSFRRFQSPKSHRARYLHGEQRGRGMRPCFFSDRGFRLQTPISAKQHSTNP